jgi:hypothetical protein
MIQRRSSLIKTVFINLFILTVLLELIGLGYYYVLHKNILYFKNPSDINSSQISAQYQIKQVVFHPYLGYINHEGRRDAYGANNHGFQYYRPFIEANLTAWDYPYKRGKDDVLVGIFGGSVGLGFAVTAQETGKFAEMLQELSKYQGKKIKILNFAVSGFRQPQQLQTLSYYLMLGQKFDLVINLDGFNEVVSGFTNWREKAEPTYPPDQIWGGIGRSLEQGRISLSSNEELLSAYYERSATKSRDFAERSRFGIQYLYYILNQNYYKHMHHKYKVVAQSVSEEYTWFPAKHRYTWGENFNLPEYTATRWCEASILMNKLMVGEGYYLHVLQPDQWFKPSGEYVPIDPNHIYKFVIDPINQTYPEFLRQIPNLKEAKVDIMDATMIFKDKDFRKVYADDCCHFTQEGYEILFRKIVEHLKTVKQL